MIHIVGSVCLALMGAPAADSAGEAIEIISPVPNGVIQREGYVPQEAHPHAVGGPARGFADVDVTFRTPLGGEANYRLRVTAIDGGNLVTDQVVKAELAGEGLLRSRARIPAGGWYRVEIQAKENDRILQGAVEPVGVGEVFLVAGQSYATNTNEEKLSPQDSRHRVVAWNFRDGRWTQAADPQPAPDGSDGGSIWPPLGDELSAMLDVPIGFANVAWGGTSSQQWLPEGELHRRLVDAGKRLGRFRAVLWQQGESDVIGKTTIDQYVENLSKIRDSADAAWTGSPPWLLAKSTLHPTVYNDPEGETRIRQAIDRLTQQPGFAPGPDTDLLDGDRRGPLASRRHFTGIGQRQAARLWSHAIWSLLQRPQPPHEIARSSIDERHLLEFPWSSSIIHGESSILIREDEQVTARLAFPAAEILSIRAANRSYDFQPGIDFELVTEGVKSGTRVVFKNTGPIEAFRPEEFFPPAGSPGSYRHRTHRPDQGLLYRPGRGMHDRQVEITYRRKDLTWPGPASMTAPAGTLERTTKLLQEGKPIRLAVSGDSISFGWDASRWSAAPPYQFPYPVLLAAQLRETFGSPVELVNRAVSGWSIASGVEDLPRLLESHPDLILIAYGMNDVGRGDPAWFGQQAQAMVDKIRVSAPEADIILVASMVGHREWSATPSAMFEPYRDALAKRVGPKVALADVTTVWRNFLLIKHDLDLSGNGLNHPNDFGHRLYAQTILSLLAPSPK